MRYPICLGFCWTPSITDWGRKVTPGVILVRMGCATLHATRSWGPSKGTKRNQEVSEPSAWKWMRWMQLAVKYSSKIKHKVQEFDSDLLDCNPAHQSPSSPFFIHWYSPFILYISKTNLPWLSWPVGSLQSSLLLPAGSHWMQGRLLGLWPGGFWKHRFLQSNCAMKSSFFHQMLPKYCRICP